MGATLAPGPARSLPTPSTRQFSPQLRLHPADALKPTCSLSSQLLRLKLGPTELPLATSSWLASWPGSLAVVELPRPASSSHPCQPWFCPKLDTPLIIQGSERCIFDPKNSRSSREAQIPA